MNRNLAILMAYDCKVGSDDPDLRGSNIEVADHLHHAELQVDRLCLEIRAAVIIHQPEILQMKSVAVFPPENRNSIRLDPLSQYQADLRKYFILVGFNQRRQ